MLKTTQTGICFRVNVFIYIEAILARKHIHGGIFAPKILKILKAVKMEKKRGVHARSWRANRDVDVGR